MSTSSALSIRRFGRLSASILAVVAVCASLLVGPAAMVSAAPAAVPGSEVRGVGSGRCLDVVGQSTVKRTQVNIYDCATTANQDWTVTKAGELRVYDSRMCLDVRSHSTKPGAIVQIYPCTGRDNQKWRINPNKTITGVESGLCLDVFRASKSNGARVQMWTCHGGENQQWTTAALNAADTEPPSIPGNPRTSDLRCDSVTFAWDAATDNVGVAFYDIYHDGQQVTTVSGTTLSTTLNVIAGVPWGWYVNARDAADNVSQASTTVTVTPPPCEEDTEKPTAPSGLGGEASGTSISLSWTASTDNIGVKAYDIFRDDVKVGTVSGTAANAPATTFVDSGLDAKKKYSYTVTARDAQDNVSAASNAVEVTTGSDCTTSVCEVTTVTTETDIPWGMTALPDGSMLYSRRDAHDIIRLDPKTGEKVNIGGVPNVESTDGEGGLLGLAVSTTFDEDGWVYIMHTSPTDNRIVRIRLVNDTLDLKSEQVLVSGILRNKFHDGGRLRFGPDGKLYASTGDAQNPQTAQDTASLNGKVLRINPDGSVPSDNPFGNYVWSYGHRNPQGLAFDSQGRLWQQEFGNSEMDETNLVVKGGNYGWPDCEGTAGTCDKPGFLAPKRTYPTADASCSGIAIVKDVLYVSCLRGTRMYQQVISGSSLGEITTYFNGTYGRLRTVEPAPDGGLWISTSNKGDKDSTPNNSDEKILHVTLGG
jgi:glucose/arabinose dehydrogenase